MSEPIVISVEFISSDRTKDTEYLGEERFTGSRFSQLAHAVATHLLPLERGHGRVTFEVIHYKRGAIVYAGKGFTGHLAGVTEILTLFVMQTLKR